MEGVSLCADCYVLRKSAKPGSQQVQETAQGGDSGQKTELERAVITSCSECGKPSFVYVESNPLCVDCYKKYKQSLQPQSQEDNSSVEELGKAMGIYVSEPGPAASDSPPQGQPPRVMPAPPKTQQPAFTQPTAPSSPSSSLSAAEIQRIEVSANRLINSGNTELAGALKNFTDAVIQEPGMSPDVKNQFLEQISFLSSQAVLPKESIKKGMVKAMLAGVGELIAQTPLLRTHWSRLHPLIERVLP